MVGSLIFFGLWARERRKAQDIDFLLVLEVLVHLVLRRGRSVFCIGNLLEIVLGARQ